MLTSLALIFVIGLTLGAVFTKLHLPRLLGMLLAGMLLGPCVLDLLDTSMLGVSADLRRLALIIILTRAGLTLDIADLKKVGRPAVLMCFVPACLEILGVLLLASRVLGLSLLDAAVMGAVVAAVSPAVVVPQMLRLMEEGWGTEKSIPQLILAGASADDVFVIVLFTSLTGLAAGQQSLSPSVLVQIPLSVVTGIGAGLAAGAVLAWVLRRVSMRAEARLLLLLSVTLLLAELEKRLGSGAAFSGLLAVMSCGLAVQRRAPDRVQGLREKYNGLWAAAEVLLFVLVGTAVDLGSAVKAGPAALLVILGALAFRMAGVLLCLIGTELDARERIFCVIAYLPKATVQAAIGAVPLAMGLSCGPMVLTVSVLSILLTAPLGAVGMNLTYKKLLKQNVQPERHI